jgi:hypothetical protein
MKNTGKLTGEFGSSLKANLIPDEAGELVYIPKAYRLTDEAGQLDSVLEARLKTV